MLWLLRTWSRSTSFANFRSWSHIQARSLQTTAPVKAPVGHRSKKNNPKDDLLARLVPSPNNPIAVELSKVSQPLFSKKNNQAYDTKHYRTQIVSPSLCDDILSYIGPTLEQHKGCDILDVNPGACVWSAKLHNYLQPRSHILLEPQPEAYKAFQDPLISQPGSKYKLVKGDPFKFETYDEISSEENLPHQPRLPADDPRKRQLNRMLLVTASLMFDPQMPGMGFTSMARQVANRLAKASWSHEFFHRYGQVRMLFWVSREDAEAMMPTTFGAKKRFPLGLAKTNSMNVVAASTRAPRVGFGKTGNRDFRYELQGRIQVMTAAKEAGIMLPPHRMDNLDPLTAEIIEKGDGSADLGNDGSQEFMLRAIREGVDLTGHVPENVISTQNLLAAAQKDPALAELNTPQKHPKKKSDFGRKLTQDRATLATFLKYRAKSSAITDLADELFELECAVASASDDTAKQELQTKLEQVSDEYATLRSKVNVRRISFLENDIDDRRSLRSQATHLPWDKRPFEPLSIRQNETWPNNEVTLLDMTPKPLPPDQDYNFLRYWEDLLIPLLDNAIYPITEALEATAPGASELIDKVPSLRDPAKGGRPDVSRLRVRMLTIEHLDELCKAFREWPFRPPNSDYPQYFRSSKHSLFPNGEWGEL